MVRTRKDLSQTPTHHKRDIADESQTQRRQKRLRVSRACDQCRKRRDRCDGQQPTCQSCLHGNRTCTYNESTKKRGLPAGYVRALETTLGLLFVHVDGSEEVVSALFDEERDEREIQVPNRVANLGERAPSRSAKSLLNAWRESKVSELLEGFLLAAESTEDDDTFMQRLDDRLIHLIPRIVSGKAPARTSFGNQNDVLDCDEALPGSSIEAVDDEGYEDSSVHEPQSFNQFSDQDVIVAMAETPSPCTPQPMHASSTSLTQTQPTRKTLPPHWSELLDIHFAATHCWFPISQKYNLLRTAHLLANSDSTDQQEVPVSPGDLAFLWAIFAYTSHLSTACNFTFDAINDTQLPVSSPQRLYALTISQLYPPPSEYEPGHVRALLMLALTDIGRGEWTSAWTFVGQAVYIAVDLGVITANASNIDDGQRRTALGCFLLDALVSAQLKRRPYLRRTDLDSIGLMPVDSNEEWEALQTSTLVKGSNLQAPAYRASPGRVLSTFNQLLILAAIVNDTICHHEAGKSEMALKTALGEAEDWNSRHSSHFHACSGSDQVAMRSPHQLNLELAHIAAVGLVQAKLAILNPTYAGASASTVLERSDQAVSLLLQQREMFGQGILTPVSTIYLGLFSQTTTTLQGISPVGLASSGLDGIATLISKLEQTWRASQSLEQTGDMPEGREINIFQEVTPAQPPERFQGFGSRGNLTHDAIMPQASMHSGQTGSLDGLSVGTTLVTPSMSAGFGSLEHTLVNRPDEDELFRSLAMLDPVDWTVNQPEFMSHLGFMSATDMPPTDFTS